ncbi:MAG: ribbon-helix-helix protein, CopG family [Actinomycetota bacterium]|nr:ribbon-helix-helix protein, CopG family [Actinomycetota bacterium]
MPDILIRDVPAEDVARIDAHAARLGLSRSAYLKRRLLQDAQRVVDNVRAEHLTRFGEVFADLADAETMSEAWK